LAFIALPLILPVMLFIRGKTATRSLTVSPEGITTEIGRLKAQLPWSKIKIIQSTADSILISGATGNAFFIPTRAFASPEQKEEFVAKTLAWAKSSRSFS
jgi:hypothetical protein